MLAAYARPVSAGVHLPAPVEPVALLVRNLQSPAAYPHPADRIDARETHISYVLLAGDFAYKVKKPVDLGFLDFRSLEARRRFCEEEVRINRRTAPGLYLGVVAITGSEAAPRVDGQGEPIEYAVRMRRFADDALLESRASAGTLASEEVVALARTVARFHAGAARAGKGSPYGSAELVLDSALGNLSHLQSLAPSPELLPALGDLRDWTVRSHAGLRTAMDARQAEGFVRDGHGDLHLGNVVLLEGRPVPFDAIEFDAKLRWIDVMNDIAFTVMDLEHHGLHGQAMRFLNAYLEETGDYEGLALLRFYLVYRALVRAKVSAIRLEQPDLESHERMTVRKRVRDHVLLAQRLSWQSLPRLVVMHGLSGSGKSTMSEALAASLGAIRLRSDIERKRLSGLDPLARTNSPAGGGLYSPDRSRATYERLGHLAQSVLAAGFPVIIDAAFLRKGDRQSFRAIAERAGATFTIASCSAPLEVLRRRVAERAGDASEARVDVLDHQLAVEDRLDPSEREAAVFL